MPNTGGHFGYAPTVASGTARGDSLSRRLRRLGTAALVVATGSAISLLALAAPAAAAGPVYVGTGGTDDVGCGTSADEPCASIDHALSLAGSGGTIILAPGTYTEQNRITSPVTITGASADTVTVQGTPGGTDPTFLIGSEGTIDVTLQNMTIVAGPVADAAVAADFASNVTLNSVTVSADPASAEAAGLSVDGASTATVTDSSLSGLNLGVRVAGDGTATVTGSTISGNWIGVQAIDGGTVSVGGSTVDGNAMYGALVGTDPSDLVGDSGLQEPDPETDGTLHATSSSFSGNRSADDSSAGIGVVVGNGTADLTDCTLSANAAVGLVATAGTATVDGGRVSGNGEAGLATSGYARGAVTVTGTTIAGNATEPETFAGGIVLVGGSVQASGVTIEGGGMGVMALDGTLTLTDSAVRDNNAADGSGTGFGGAGVMALALGGLLGGEAPLSPQGVSIDVSHSEISGNGIGMILIGDVGTRVSHSTIADNAGVGVLTFGPEITQAVSMAPSVARNAPLDAMTRALAGAASGGHGRVLGLPASVAVPADGPLAGADAAGTPVAATDTPTVVTDTPGGALLLLDSTVAGNLGIPLGDDGEPISGIAAGPGSTVLLGGSVIAGPAGAVACYALPTDPGTATSSIADGGYNVDSDGSCGLDADTSRPGVEPKLGDLAENAGPSGDPDSPTLRTMLPAMDSPALDLVPVGATVTVPDTMGLDPMALCDRGATDQVGTARPQGKACDAGAAERVIPPLTVTTTSLPGGMVGVQYPTTTLHATGWYGGPYFWEITDGTLPRGLTLDQRTGTLSGIPRASGTFTFTVRASMPGDPDTATLSIVIAAAPVTTSTSTGTMTTVTNTQTTTAITTQTATVTSTAAPSTTSGPGSSTTSPPGTTTISPTSSGPELANTGVDTRPGLVVGGVALLLGLGLTLLGRRRRGTH